MQREILFKAIALDSKQWVEGSYHSIIGEGPMRERTINPPYFKDRGVKFNQHYILQRNLPSDTGWTVSDSFTTHGVIPETVCQYSGYEDQNETKIFSGDIVDDGGLNRGEVELDPDCGWVVNTSHATLLLSQLCNYSTVTGNIHDHHTTSKGSI